MTGKGWPESQQDALIGALSSDHATADLDPADAAMLAYAAKLTLTPSEIVAADVANLRAAGFADRAIHDICAIAAYFAFVNRIADGLGVEVESGDS